MPRHMNHQKKFKFVATETRKTDMGLMSRDMELQPLEEKDSGQTSRLESFPCNAASRVPPFGRSWKDYLPPKLFHRPVGEHTPALDGWRDREILWSPSRT